MPAFEKNGKVWLAFSYKNVRCRESLGIPISKGNLAYAKRLMDEINAQIAKEEFSYANYFPESKKCVLFGEEAKQKITFEECAQRWLMQQERLYALGALKSTTHYQRYVRLYILPEIGHLPMKNIKRHHIEDLICSLSSKSKKYINNILTPLRQIFRDAFEREEIDANLMDRIRNPKIPKPDIVPFSVDEMDEILQHLQESHPADFPFFAIMFYTGMRTGEVLAMKWDNVDFRRSVYYVRESMSERKLGSPKTTASTREVALTSLTIEILKDLRKKQVGPEFIFCGKDGAPQIDTTGLVRRAWRPTLRALGIAYRWPYQCRHTFAIRALNAGVKPEHVARQLGHTSLQMLFHRYARWTSDCGIDISALEKSQNVKSKWHYFDTKEKPTVVTVG